MNETRPEAKDIIAASSKAAGVDPDRAYAAMVQLVETDPMVRVIRANNSLFTINNMGDGQAQIHLDTIDSPRELIDSIGQFMGSMKKAGFKTGTFEAENPKIFKAIEMAGGKVSSQVDDSGNQVGVVEF